MKPIDIGTLFEVLAERESPTVVHLSRPLDIAPDSRVAYRVEELADLVRDAAGWLAAAGARPGDRVAIVKDNHWDYALLAFAAVRVGAVPAVIGEHLPPETLEILLKRLDPAILITTSRNLQAARNAGTDLTAFAGRALSIDLPALGALSLDNVRGHEPPPPHQRNDHDPLVVMHTSGTTGTPKLVVHSTYTLIRRIVEFETRRQPLLTYKRDDSVACASSYSHGRTIAWTASVFWMQPREVVVVADTDPLIAEPFLRVHPPTTLEATPATYIRWQPLTTGPDNVFRNIRLYVSTFDAIHPPAVRAFLAASRRRYPVMLNGWGQTETGPLTFRLLTRKAIATIGGRHPMTRNLGWPAPFRTGVRVVDPQSLRPLGREQLGVVMIRTKARGLGYLGEQDRWADKIDGDWFNTGDVGLRTRTGSLLLLDREVDVIPGMSCVEIEDVIDDRLPEVLECIVLGTPGRLPLPVLVTGDRILDHAAWQAAIHDLPPLEEPAILTWDEVPRTATGKVRRMQLREQLEYGSATFGTGRWT